MGHLYLRTSLPDNKMASWEGNRGFGADLIAVATAPVQRVDLLVPPESVRMYPSGATDLCVRHTIMQSTGADDEA